MRLGGMQCACLQACRRWCYVGVAGAMNGSVLTMPRTRWGTRPEVSDGEVVIGIRNVRSLCFVLLLARCLLKWALVKRLHCGLWAIDGGRERSAAILPSCAAAPTFDGGL